MRRLSWLYLAAAVCALARPHASSVAISVTRTVYAPPDQAQVSLTVASAPDTSLDEVLASLMGAGIPAANFTAVRIEQTNPPTLDWSFVSIVPLSKLSNLLHSPITSYFIENLTASTQQVCSAADLISDARTQARKLADAAGRQLGPILALTDGPSPLKLLKGGGANYLPSVRERSFQTAGPVRCSIAVEFALLP